MPNFTNLPERHFVDKAKKLSFGDQDKDTYFDGDTLNTMLDEIQTIKNTSVKYITHTVRPQPSTATLPCALRLTSGTYNDIIDEINAGNIVNLRFLGKYNLDIDCRYEGRYGYPAEDDDKTNFYIFSVPSLEASPTYALKKRVYIVIDKMGGTNNSKAFGISSAIVGIEM